MSEALVYKDEAHFSVATLFDELVENRKVTPSCP